MKPEEKTDKSAVVEKDKEWKTKKEEQRFEDNFSSKANPKKFKSIISFIVFHSEMT